MSSKDNQNPSVYGGSIKKEGTSAQHKMAFARSFKGKEPMKPMGATGRKTVAEHQRDRIMRQGGAGDNDGDESKRFAC